jgi:FixJ family two-component response regulator
MAKGVLDRLRKGKHLLQDEKLARLSAQEERILGLVAEGNTNGQIAGELGLAEKTVKNYLQHPGQARGRPKGRSRRLPGPPHHPARHLTRRAVRLSPEVASR